MLKENSINVKGKTLSMLKEKLYLVFTFRTVEYVYVVRRITLGIPQRTRTLCIICV